MNDQHQETGLFGWFTQRSFRAQLFILVFPLVLGTLLIALVASRQFAQARQETLREQLSEEAEDLEAVLNAPFQPIRNELEFLRTDTAARDYAEAYIGVTVSGDGENERQTRLNDSIERLRDDLRAFMQGRPLYYQIRLVDLNGVDVVRVSRMGDEIEVITTAEDIRRSRSFQAALELVTPEQIWASQVRLQSDSEGNKLPMMQIVTPLAASPDSVQWTGYFIIDLDLETVFRDLRDYDITGGFSYLLDEDGYYLAHSQSSQQTLLFGRDAERGAQLEGDLAERILTGEKVDDLDLVFDDQDYLAETVVIRPLSAFRETQESPRWTVVATIAKAEVLGDLASQGTIFLMLFVVLAVCTIGLIWLQANILVSRLDALKLAFRQVYHGDFTTKLAVGTGNELDNAAADFNHMTGYVHDVVTELESRVQARIRDLELVGEISREVAGLRHIDLVLNRAINRIVERFGYYHAQVFLCDDLGEFAMLVASTGEAGQRLLSRKHKLAIGSDSVIGRVTALGITIIAGDTAAISDVPWQPNIELPATRAEMALPLKVEGKVIGAVDIQSTRPDAFTPSEVEIFQVLADQLAIAIETARLIHQLEGRVDEVGLLNQRLTEKVWTDFANKEPDEPLAYRYNLLNVEPMPPASIKASNGQEHLAGVELPTYAAPIEVAGNEIGQIETMLPMPLTGDEEALVDAVASRVALALDNARLVQETQIALTESQRLYEMSRTVNSAAELDIYGVYSLITEQLVFEKHLDRVAILLAEPVPSYYTAHLTVAHLWSRSVMQFQWKPGQQLDLLQHGLSRHFAEAPRQPVLIRRSVENTSAKGQVFQEMFGLLDAESLLLIPLVAGTRWFGLLICGSTQAQAFSQNFINFTNAVADQLTIGIDNRRLIAEVGDEARRALALAEAGQLVSQIGANLESGTSRLFRAVSGSGEFDRWWFGLLELNGYELKRVAASTAGVDAPDIIDMRLERNALTEAILLRQLIVVNDFSQEHSVLGEIGETDRLRYAKHLAVPVMVGGEQLLGALLIGRGEDMRDLDERDIQLATTLASQLAVATQNRRFIAEIEGQHQTLQTTLEAMLAGVVVLNLQGETVLSNQQAVNLLGPGVRSRLFSDTAYPLYQVGTEERYSQEQFVTSLTTGQRVKVEDVYVVQPDGRRVDILMNAAVAQNEQGQVSSVVLVFQEITELRELEHALQESLNETTLLYEASRALATVSTTSGLVSALVAQLQTLQPDRVIVLLQEGQEAGNAHIRVASVWPEAEDLSDVGQLQIPITALTPQQGLIVGGGSSYADAQIPLDLRQSIAAVGVQTIASYPLRVRGERVMGWFSVVFTETKNIFTPEQRRLLATLADQASVALNAQRLYESTQQALRSVANLYRGSKRIAESQDITEAVDAIRDELMNFKPDRVDLVLQRTPESPDALNLALSWPGEPSLQNIPCIPLDLETLKLQATFSLMGREEYYIQDMANGDDSDLYQALRQVDTPYRAILSVPLRVAGRTVGRLAVGFLKPRNFSPDDRQFVTMLADSTAYIVENELLFQQTQDSLEETGVLYQASRAIANAQSREDVVQAMIDYAASAQVDKVMLIDLLSSSWDSTDAVVAVSATWGRGEFLDLKGLHFARDQMPIWNSLASSEIIWSDDVNTDSELNDFLRLGYQTLDVASFVVVPLQTPNRPIGAILLASTQPRVHLDREIRIYQSLADQAAIQLENKRLYEQAEIRARQLATSAEVTRAVLSILNLDELFPRMVALIRDAFSYDHAQIFMIDEEVKHAVLRAATGEAGRQMLEIHHFIPLGSLSVVGQSVVRGEPFVVNDTSAPNVIHRPNPYLPQTRAELAVPLIVKGTIVGVLDVQANQPGAFNDDDLQVLSSLADQLAIAIDNAQLFDISQKRAAEMTFLFDVTSTAAVAGHLLETLESIGITLIRQMRGKETAIFLYHPEENMLKAEVVVTTQETERGIEYQFVEHEVFIPVGQGLVGWVGEHRQPLVVADFSRESRYIPSISNTVSGIFVPLMFGEVLIGVLGVEGDRIDQYGEDDLRLLQTLSTSLTAVIQNLQLVDELQRSNERLREIDQMKTNFLAAMSHELRTPLNSIIGFSRVILKGIDGPISEMQRQDIQTIHDSGKHLLGLVNDILDQAKIEAGKMELVKEFFDLEAVIKGVMSTAKGLTKDKPIQLFTEMQSELPAAFGDEFRTRQILVNLVSNASKFTHEGSITLNAYVAPDKKDGRSMIVVSVADTGIGIAEQDLSRIFESFQQVDNSTTRSVEGTGLGLPLARSLAELQGGDMWVESMLNSGSTFYVTIPGEPELVVEAEEPEVSEEKGIRDEPTQDNMRAFRDTDDPTLPPRTERRVVLAIDDEVGMIDLYRRYLSREGWQVIGVTDPKSVEERIVAHQPKLILLDINMPTRTGWEVLEKLQEQANSIPVIVCSIDNDTGKSAALGAALHLIKPFVESDLVQAVQAIVRT